MAVNQTAQAPSSLPERSVFDPTSTGGNELDWSSIYFYVGLAASAACEAFDNLQLLGLVHSGVKYDTRVRAALDHARDFREHLQNMAATSYARFIEQGEDAR